MICSLITWIFTLYASSISESCFITSFFFTELAFEFMLISVQFCRSIGHLDSRRGLTGVALKTLSHLTSLLHGKQWKSYMTLAKFVQSV